MASSLHAYLSDADQVMVTAILEASPGESLSGLVQSAIRARFAQLSTCEHDVCACLACGAVMGHPAPSTVTTTAAARPTRTAATSTAVLQIEDDRRSIRL